jgi:hypothetical protein
MAATAERHRRREEIRQEVERRFLAKRDHHEVVGRGDARFHVLIEMLLDIQDDLNDLRGELRQTTRRVNDHVDRARRRY